METIDNKKNLKKFNQIPYRIQVIEELTNEKLIDSMIDFKNEKMIVGAPEPNDYTFKGKMDYGNEQKGMMRMDVWIQDDRGEQNKLLVDTGTLYSQYLYTGSITLEGINERGSKGKLKMHNAKILPKDLVGVGQKILGYNDLYKGYMYIDYETDTIYINQN